MTENDEALAKRRFLTMNLARFAALILAMIGIAAARGAIALPELVGWVLAIGGTLAFFFAPPLLARHWNSDKR